MSVEWLNWAWDQDIENPGAKLVLLTLANWANPINPSDSNLMRYIPEELRAHTGKLGWAWPSLDQLRKKCSSKTQPMGERTLRRHIDVLEEMDLVLTFARYRPDGRKSSDGYLLITSPAILAAGTSPAKNDTSSPAKLAATYEDTQGLIQEGRVKNTRAGPSVNKPPLPPFRVSDHLRSKDWAQVNEAIIGRDGVKLSLAYFVQGYDAWIAKKGIEPRHVLPHFLDFIRVHKEKNKI